MDPQAPSLASLSLEILDQVQDLCSRPEQHATEFSTPISDASMRFQLWGCNTNAFQHGQVSLEHQIREAPSLQRSFRQRLRSLKEDLTDLDDTILAITSADVVTYTCSSREESMVLALAQDAHIEVLELLKAVQEDISSLFKLSSLVEKVTYRDDYAIAGAAIHDTQILHKELEVRDIQDHFPRLKGSVWLLQRLVQANSARRKYLKYRAFHHDRVPVWSQHVLEQGDDDEVSMEDKIPSIHHSDQISMADVNTTGLDSLQEEDEDDHVSQASRDDSIPEISLNQIPTFHTLEELCQGGEVFVCPYCKDEQAMTTEAAWRRHMFSDLKAYVCLAEDCELYMFTSSEAWMSHQLSEHLVVWSCPFCDEPSFSSGEYIQSHIRFCHPAEFSEEQLEQLTTSSKHSADSIRASECPFCDWAVASGDLDRCTFQDGGYHVTPVLFQRHVCSHLEQLALSTSLWTKEDDRKDRIETGSRQDHVAMIPDGFSATIRNLENMDAVNDESLPSALQQQSWGFDAQSYNPYYGPDDMSSRTHSSTSLPRLRTTPPTAAPLQRPPLASVGTASAPDPRTQWELDAETARLRAQVEAEEREMKRQEVLRRREREKADEAETRLIRKMVEHHEREARRRQEEVDRKTERLRKQYRLKPPSPVGNQSRHSAPSLPTHQQQQQQAGPSRQGPPKPVYSSNGLVMSGGNPQAAPAPAPSKMKKKSFWEHFQNLQQQYLQR